MSVSSGKLQSEEFMPDLKSVLKQLQSEKAALENEISGIDRALAVLGSKDRRGGGRSNLSAASRNRIAMAQKKRWARWKTEQKSR